jgi:SAM-dependent methyltransferase
MTPDWQLPPGTDRGLWDYVSSERVAREYDTALAGSPLLELDLRFADEHLPTPGRLIDLGCGTGRALIHFARRGFQCLGVDLSETMLDFVRQKAEREGLAVERLKANLVELDVLPAAGFDYALCLFSTLGMIRGVVNRRQVLGHVRRILKPGGVFVLHVHNASYCFGRGLGNRGTEPGDHTMPQHRGGAELTIHHYTRGEIFSELSAAGFRVNNVTPVGTGPDGHLPFAWCLPSFRAHGFLVEAIRA